MNLEKGEEMRTQIEIGPPMPEDVREITEVFRDSWLQTYPNAEYGIKRESLEQQWQELMTDEALAERVQEITDSEGLGLRFLVCRADDHIVGVCRFRITEKYNYLGALYVRPEYQRRGIGKALLDEAEKQFDPIKDTILTVAPYNLDAKRLYESLGFHLTERPLDLAHGVRLTDGTIIPAQEMRRPARKQP